MSKNGHFSNFIFFRQYRPERSILRYSRTKKRLSRLWKQEFQIVKKLTFFQRVLLQKWPFFKLFFFLGNIRRENVFYDILQRKNAFLGYKKKKFKKSKNPHFSKWVNPWFWCKNGHFSNFFFIGNIGQKKAFYDILEEKNVFLSYKKKKFTQSKNWNFFKRVKRISNMFF